MLEEALAAGVAAGGGDAMLGGVLPTPAASVLTRRLRFDLAAVVSASHNPFADNGIKFLNARGTKLDDDAELAIEARMDEPTGERVGGVRTLEGAFDDYVRELRTAFALDLSGLRIALDCANGATHRAAPVTFGALGADLVLTAVEPDGRNINADCGSTHPDGLVALVSSSGADIGFAYDGDGDRMLAVDGKGRLHDGDDLIALIARDLQGRGELEGGVAVTVMTNFGFMKTMEAEGIEVVQTQVGDRYVIEALLERDWRLGGEQSGHIVWTEYTPTGDGIAASLLALRALGGRRLEDVKPFERLPQRLENVRIADRRRRAGSRPAVERGRGREREARGPRQGARAPVRHGAPPARDGGGARRGRVRGDLRPARRGRPARARLATARPPIQERGRKPGATAVGQPLAVVGPAAVFVGAVHS